MITQEKASILKKMNFVKLDLRNIFSFVRIMFLMTTSKWSLTTLEKQELLWKLSSQEGNFKIRRITMRQWGGMAKMNLKNWKQEGELSDLYLPQEKRKSRSQNFKPALINAKEVKPLWICAFPSQQYLSTEISSTSKLLGLWTICSKYKQLPENKWDFLTTTATF